MLTVYFCMSSGKLVKARAREAPLRKLVTRIRIFRTYNGRKTKKEDSAYCIRSTRLQFESFITFKRIRDESPSTKAGRAFKITVKSSAKSTARINAEQETEGEKVTNLFRTRESQRVRLRLTCVCTELTHRRREILRRAAPLRE